MGKLGIRKGNKILPGEYACDCCRQPINVDEDEFCCLKCVQNGRKFINDLEQQVRDLKEQLKQKKGTSD
jgi:Zn finger protein HypA/HybF involved in hydrogenase expression